jgi:hypothetical protein
VAVQTRNLLVRDPDLAVDGGVNDVQEGRRLQAADRRRRRSGVVADDVVLGGTFEACERVAQLRQRLADPLARRGRVDGLERGARARVAGGEERHLVPSGGEPVRQQRHDRFGACVRGRRHREPDGADQPDP